MIPADVGIVSDAKAALVALLGRGEETWLSSGAFGEGQATAGNARDKLHRPMELDEVPIRPHRVF